MDDLRGTPLSVGTLEEIIDENHAIVSASVGPEYYVSILSIVDKGQLEPGSSVLLHHKTNSVVGLLQDEADPMVSVMKASSIEPPVSAAFANLAVLIVVVIGGCG